jgi:UPF0755 protein
MKNIRIILTVLIVILLAGAGGFVWYMWSGIPQNSPKNTYTLSIQKGTNLTTIAEKLAADGAITSKDVFLLKSRSKDIKPLQIGDYILKLPAKSDEILEQINAISIQKEEEIRAVNAVPKVTITFKEGVDVDDIIFLLDQKGVATKADLLAYVQDEKSFSKDKYPFLPNRLNCTYGNLKNCAKYSIEGYLYPDTYTFFKPAKPADIFAKMLDNFNAKVWSKLETKPKNFQETIILASVLQKETGRTKYAKSLDKDELKRERQDVADVFINRTTQGVKWQSDATAAYGHGYNICQQTYKVENCKYLDDPIVDTAYNTYLIQKAPIAPICNPDFDNISAALNPRDNNYLFFVMDGTGKTYFGTTSDEHEKNIIIATDINNKLGI